MATLWCTTWCASRTPALFVNWEPYLATTGARRSIQAIDIKHCKMWRARLLSIPDGIQVQRQVAKIYDDRRKMAGGALAPELGYG